MNSMFRKTLGMAAALAVLAGPAMAQQGPPPGEPGHYEGPQTQRGPSGPGPQQPGYPGEQGQHYGAQEPQHYTGGPGPQQPGRPGEQGHYGAPEPQHYAGEPGRPPHSDGWRRGDRFDGNREVVHDWHNHGLRQPPAGYEWVSYGGQFMLIAVTTGLIASIIAGSSSPY